MAVEFNDESQAQRQAQMYAQIQTNAQSGLEAWLINKGVVKTHEQANKLLIGLSLVILLLSGYIMLKPKVSTTGSHVPPKEELNPTGFTPGS